MGHLIQSSDTKFLRCKISSSEYTHTALDLAVLILIEIEAKIPHRSTAN